MIYKEKLANFLKQAKRHNTDIQLFETLKGKTCYLILWLYQPQHICSLNG